MKVMIVDDDREFTDELAALLRDAGHTVEAFFDSVAALNGVHRVKPEIILLDIRMDKLNGYQTACYFRKFQDTATTPIIGMSAYAGADAGAPGQTAAACGMNAFVQKPFGLPEIIDIIEQHAGLPAAEAVRAGITAAGGPPEADIGQVKADIANSRITPAGVQLLP